MMSVSKKLCISEIKHLFPPKFIRTMFSSPLSYFYYSSSVCAKRWNGHFPYFLFINENDWMRFRDKCPLAGYFGQPEITNHFS